MYRYFVNVLFITILQTLCVVIASDDQWNVGSALFSQSDLKKTKWTTTEICTLRARRHFQALIAPPNSGIINEKFVKTFMNLVSESYAYVNKISKDPSTAKIMNAALSDTFGGFLKTWVLPVTKFAYYGGTVSQEESTRVFELYDDIKKCLKTNGTGWRQPNPDLLSTMTISIAPLQMTSTRRTHNPCDNIAFFEDTSSGLAVPVPKVFWNKNSEYIFIPLKNISVMPLRDTFSNFLIQYYETAKECIRNRNATNEEQLEDEDEFEKRFQNWLDKEVIPHLSDESLYPALGSVLTLVNKSIGLIDAMIDTATVHGPFNKFLADFHLHVSSKKMLFVLIILLMEFACCVPTLICLFCSRYNTGKRFDLRTVYCDSYKANFVTGDCAAQCPETLNRTSVQISEEINVLPSPHNARKHSNITRSLSNAMRTQSTEIQAPTNGIPTQSNKVRIQSEDASLKNEIFSERQKTHRSSWRTPGRRSYHGKIPEVVNQDGAIGNISKGTGNTLNLSTQTRPKYFDTRSISCINSESANSKSSKRRHSEVIETIPSQTSLETVKDLEPNKTVTVFKNSENSFEKTEFTCNKSIQENIIEFMTKPNNSQFERVVSKGIMVASTMLDVRKPSRQLPESLARVPLAGLSKTVRRDVNPKKFVEIKIDGHRDIAFDIRTGETIEYTYKSKKSKIPKRVNDEVLPVGRGVNPYQSVAKKCMIPRLKAFDDSGIVQKSEASTQGKKLNSTL